MTVEALDCTTRTLQMGVILVVVVVVVVEVVGMMS